MVGKIFLLFVLIFFTCQCGKLPIQAHSFNDLDYLSNLIGKGIDYYKLDLSMANRKSCEQFSTWNKTQKCYKTRQYIQEICCLAFRGDASSRPNFGYPFNISSEFPKFLDAVLAKIVTYQPKRQLLFAINFQYSHSFNDFITEEFLSSLADVMIKYPHNLLMGTGSDSFILEYDRICYGKGAPECTDARRKISKSALFLQSGAMNPFDPRDHYKRFRNFNTYYKGIEHYCQNGFPDWINKYPQFPLIFWEPSNEKQVQYVMNLFTSPNCMKKHGRNISGMAMAINIDSEMLDIYTKNTVEPVSLKPNLQANVEPYGATNYSWAIWNQKLLATQRINFKLTKIKVGDSELVYSVSTDFFSPNKVLFQRWQYDSKTQTMRQTGSRQHSAIFRSAVQIKNLMQDGIGHLVLITSGDADGGLSTVYYFDSNTFELVNYKSWVKIEASCMRGKELIYVTCDSVCTIKGAIEFKETGTYGSFNSELFLSKINSIEAYQNNYLVVGQSAAAKDLTAVLVIRDGLLVPPAIPLALGQSPKIFRKEAGKQFGVLVQNAMCHSALLINNNDMNKCNFFREPEFASLRNVRGLVNLAEFDFTDLLKNTVIVSPCHPKISLTKLMNGGNSDIVELSSIGSYLISTQYLRIQDQDVTAALFCGGSNYDNAYRYRLKSSLLTTFYSSNRANYTNPVNLQSE